MLKISINGLSAPDAGERAAQQMGDADSNAEAEAAVRGRQQVSRLIQDALTAADSTMMDLARAIGVSYTAAHNWANGKNLPSPKKAKAIAEFLNVDVQLLRAAIIGSDGSECLPGATPSELEPWTSQARMEMMPDRMYARIEVNEIVPFETALEIMKLLKAKSA